MDSNIPEESIMANELNDEAVIMQVMLGTILKITELYEEPRDEHDEKWNRIHLNGQGLALDGFSKAFEVQLQFIVEPVAADEVLALAASGTIVAAKGMYSINPGADGETSIGLHGPVLSPISKSLQERMENHFSKAAD